MLDLAKPPIATASGAKTSVCLIATTDPGLFSALGSITNGLEVRVHDNGAETLQTLQSMSAGYFIADYRQLKDNWTGQRFLKQLRDMPQYESVQFWLMAESWHPEQEVFAKKIGAKGMVKRSAEAISTLVFSNVDLPKMAAAEQLEKLETVFGNYAGLMKSLHLNAARVSLASAKIEPTPKAYAQELARRLSVEDSRNQFIDAASALIKEFELQDTVWSPKASTPNKPSGASNSGAINAEKIEQINTIYRGYAGALGARLTIQKHQDLLAPGTSEALSNYVRALAEGLSDAARRKEFFTGLQSAGII
jgi:hypothetical protein